MTNMQIKRMLDMILSLKNGPSQRKWIQKKYNALFSRFPPEGSSASLLRALHCKGTEERKRWRREENGDKAGESSQKRALYS